eukprot:gene11368-11517_t
MASQPAVPSLEAAAAAAVASVDRPIYHIAPRTGWVNDPNGPLLWNGRYHLFYQHLNAGSSWSWGLSWGHCSSPDLVHWQHHDPALVPGEHTCVVKREGSATGLLPSSLTVSELCLERQLAAVPAQPSDPLLKKWHKFPSPWLTTPPTGLCLNCFRDPFVLERPSAANGQRWRVMLGAGIRQLPAAAGLPCAGVAAQPAALQDEAEEHQLQEQPLLGGAVRDGTHDAEDEARRMAALGTALVYSSQSLLSGWQFEGLLCSAGDPGVEGRVWECPVLAQVPHMRAPPVAHHNPQQQQQQQQSGDLLASTTSVEATTPDSSSSSPQEARSYFFSVSTGCSPSVYWLGSYHAGGAPETTGHGSSRSTSSTTSTTTSTATFDQAGAEGPIPLDLGDVLYAPNVLKDARTCKLSLTVGQGVGSSVQLSSHNDAAEQAGIRVLEGILHLLPFQPVRLRLLMDFSLLEVFADDGQTLSTRIYRGHWPAVAAAPVTAISGVTSEGGMEDIKSQLGDAVPCGVYVFAKADGAAVEVLNSSMHAMSSIWA